MYKLSVPIMFQTITENNKEDIVKNLKQCKVDRVFLTGIGYLFSPIEVCYSEEMKGKIEYLKSAGFEVGIWFSSFGHGNTLAHETGEAVDLSMYTKVEGLGGKNENSVCPYDNNVIEVMSENIKLIASMNPDLMMFDDDYRLNYRNYRMGCMCEKHLEEYYRRIGEVIPKEKLEKVIFSGGKNFYRTKWLELQGETLINFAKKMREAVNEINSDIRLSFCACWDTWDFEGTNCIEIAKAFAGETDMFLRTIGAPYHNSKVSMAIEASRTQAFWCRNSGIEIFCEGDVYPRPRYNVPARQLELFDLCLLASNEFDGILKYMYDYSHPFGYETGYCNRHIKNEKLRNEIKEIFADKKTGGIRVVDEMAKTENWHLPKNVPDGVSTYLCSCMENSRTAKCILTDNAIPTTYTDNESPVFIMGENAYYVSEDDLNNGAILDVHAAQILTEKGIDVGLIEAVESCTAGEHYIKENDTVTNLQGIELYKLKISNNAEVETLLMPHKTAGSYRYENRKGQRFFVLAAALTGKNLKPVEKNENYTSNYYRKNQLNAAIEYVSNKVMAVKVSGKNPDLYIIASENKDKTSLSVALINPFIDEATDIEFALREKYSTVRFVGCTGEFCGDKVKVKYVEPFGFMAFEVSK